MMREGCCKVEIQMLHWQLEHVILVVNTENWIFQTAVIVHFHQEVSFSVGKSYKITLKLITFHLLIAAIIIIIITIQDFTIKRHGHHVLVTSLQTKTLQLKLATGLFGRLHQLDLNI